MNKTGHIFWVFFNIALLFPCIGLAMDNPAPKEAIVLYCPSPNENVKVSCELKGTLFRKWRCNAGDAVGISGDKNASINQACSELTSSSGSKRKEISPATNNDSGTPAISSPSASGKSGRSDSQPETSDEIDQKLDRSQVQKMIEDLSKKINVLKQMELKKEPSKTSTQNLKGYKIGVYYNKDSEGERKSANTIIKALNVARPSLNTEPYPRGQNFFDRVKPPISFEIRFYSPEEDKAAQELQNILRQTNLPFTFFLKNVTTRTPNFIAIFVDPYA